MDKKRQKILAEITGVFCPTRFSFMRLNSLLSKYDEEHDKEIERLKAKARRQNDIAYNRALDDAARALTLTPDQCVLLERMKRTVRNGHEEA